MPEEVLGNEWGPLAGYTPTQALRMVSGMLNEKSAEVVQLKEVLEQKVAEGKETPEPPETDGPDVDKLAKMSPDEARKYIAEYTKQVAGTLVDQRLGQYRNQTFEMDRENAKLTARRKVGPDFDRWAAQIDNYLTEKNKVSREAQISPQTWEQAYTYLVGQEARGMIQGPEGTPGGTSEREAGNRMLGERPNYNPRSRRPGGREEILEDPDERHAHAMWEKQLDRKIPIDEWVAFRDNIRSITDYEEWVEQQELKKKRGER